MTVSIPQVHATDAVSLTADGIVELFHIILYPGTTHLYLKDNDNVTWNGNVYEGIPIQLRGTGSSADATVVRPTLNIFNPNAMFSAQVASGTIEGAEVIRYRVLRSNLSASTPIFIQHSWRVIRVSQLTRYNISLELREDIDGPNFLTPARMYMPPEFPSVTI